MMAAWGASAGETQFAPMLSSAATWPARWWAAFWSMR